MKKAIVFAATLCIALWIFLVFLQNKKKPSSAPTNMQMGHTADDEGPSIRFNITNVRSKQQLSDTPPFASAGGTWTVFDCVPTDDAQAVFTVAVPSASQQVSGQPFAFGKAVVWTADRTAGTHVAAIFAHKFNQPLPNPKSPQPLKPMKLETAVLGENVNRDGATFTGSGGTWNATKWFLEENGYEAEVFFNYDLQNKVGEFAEKDPDYDADLVAQIAEGLRDGPRPPRTPDSDANLTLVGPSLSPTLIPDTKHCRFAFTRDGHLIVYETNFRNSAASIIDLAQPQVAKKQIARVEGSIDGAYPIVADGTKLVLLEAMRKDEHAYSSDDPKRLWMIEGDNPPRAISGPYGDQPLLSTQEQTVSPDGRILAVTHWGGKGKTRKKLIWFYQLKGLAFQDVEVPLDLSLSEWVGDGPNLRAIARTNSFAIRESGYQARMINPMTGDVTTMPEKSPPPPTSPDGKHQFVITPHERLDVSDVASGQKRSFTFHEDDRRLCDEEIARWVSNRYIMLRLPRQPLIDITTMKMNYLTAPEEKGEYDFSPDFKWAAAAVSDVGIKVSAVKLPN